MQFIRIKCLFGRLGSHNWRYISTLNRHVTRANVIRDGRYYTTDSKGITRRNSLQYQKPATYLLTLPRSFSSEVHTTKRNEVEFKSESQTTGVQSEPAEQSQKGDSHLRLYCGGLAPETTDKDLRDVFASAKEIVIQENQNNERHALVQFETKAEVDQWVQSGQVTLNDEVVKLEYAGEKSTKAPKLPAEDNHLKVYSNGLAPSTTKNDLLDAFPTARNIYLSPEDKDSKRHAYVQFETIEEVDKWVQSGLVTVNDEVVNLRKVGERYKAPDHLKVYCSVLAPSTTRKDLLDVFPTAKDIYVSPENQDIKRHAYVQFETIEEVDKWVQSGLVTVNDEVVNLTYAGERYKVALEQQKPPDYLKVYCSRLAPSTTRKDLLDVFPTARNIYLSPVKYRKRFAYVQFETIEEVEKWVQSGLVTINDVEVNLTYVDERYIQARKDQQIRSDHLRVYCSGLAPSTTRKDLLDVFPTAINIYLSPENQDSKRHAYVQFETIEEVNKWVQSGLVTVNDEVVDLTYVGEKFTQALGKETPLNMREMLRDFP